jgi:hypothetical protein
VIAIHEYSGSLTNGSFGIAVGRTGKGAVDHHQELAVAGELQQHAVGGTVA